MSSNTEDFDDDYEAKEFEKTYRKGYYDGRRFENKRMKKLITKSLINAITKVLMKL
jgi:hypothetical protein|tara:strand:- start:365 stop:532 length:168 start_codon:yes stop_codon:yes gene_type:complete